MRKKRPAGSFASSTSTHSSPMRSASRRAALSALVSGDCFNKSPPTPAQRPARHHHTKEGWRHASPPPSARQVALASHASCQLCKRSRLSTGAYLWAAHMASILAFLANTLIIPLCRPNYNRIFPFCARFEANFPLRIHLKAHNPIA